MLPLFSYGTLRDDECQRELFDRTYPTRPATLHDHIVVGTDLGYLSAVAHVGGLVRGYLVTLDASGYAVADRWEAVEAYERTTAVALDDDGNRVDCHVYFLPGARGTIVTDNRVADMPRDAMLAEIRRFRASLTTRSTD